MHQPWTHASTSRSQTALHVHCVLTVVTWSQDAVLCLQEMKAFLCVPKAPDAGVNLDKPDSHVCPLRIDTSDSLSGCDCHDLAVLCFLQELKSFWGLPKAPDAQGNLHKPNSI